MLIASRACLTFKRATGLMFSLSLACAAAHGTAQTAEPIAPRTAWGAPDLRGLWTTATLTPLERPSSQEAKAELSQEEATELERQTVERRARLDGAAPQPGSVGGYNQVWLDAGTKVLDSKRTSLIVDPADGRIPWTPDARAVNQSEAARYGVGPYHSHVDLDTGERCISDGITLVPIQPYNMNFQIFQTPNHVAILQEMYHEVRIIPLDGRPRLDPAIRLWLGDARGRWDGDTLVVETTHFADKSHYFWAQPWRKARPTLTLVERFRRIDEQTIDYRFTVEDSTMFTQPWTAAAPMTTDQSSRGVTAGPLFEFACHEGNYALPNVLSGARAQERATYTPTSH